MFERDPDDALRNRAHRGRGLGCGSGFVEDSAECHGALGYKEHQRREQFGASDD